MEILYYKNKTHRSGLGKIFIWDDDVPGGGLLGGLESIDF
jgi:hypothetical protein